MKKFFEKIRNFPLKDKLFFLWQDITRFFTFTPITRRLIRGYFILIVLALIALSAIAFVVYVVSKFEADKINIIEQRFYFVAALVVCCIVAFSILRMYNAIVSNTRFVIKLVEEMKTLTSEVRTQVRDAKMQTQEARSQHNVLMGALDRAAAASEALKNSIVNVFSKK